MAYRCLRAVWSRLPERLASITGAAAGWMVGSILRVRRRDLEAHLAIAFPDHSPAWRRTIARRCYAHLGREAAFLARLPTMSREEIAGRVRYVGFDAVREAAAAERGVVLLTAHHGNWELAGAAIAALGLPLDVVAKGMANRRIERDLFALREGLGMRMIEMSDAPKKVLRSLGRGRVAALLPDQNAHRYGVFVPFFGRRAATSRGAALFAVRSGAPVFVGFALRLPGTPHHYVLEAQRLSWTRSGDTDQDVASLLEAYHRALEASIREHPDQYFWPHRRWKTRPPVEQAANV